MKKDEPYCERKGGHTYLRTGGKSYIANGYEKDITEPGHIGRIKFTEVDEIEFDKRINNLSEEIVKHVNAKKIVKAALLSLPMCELKKLEKNMVIHKPREVEGCYGLKFGKFEFNIVP